MDISPLADAKVFAALIAALVTVAVGVVSGGWAVWVRVQENRRAKWRRVEELMQVIHNGTSRGLWAQKLAATEMVAIARRDKQVMKVLREASLYFSSITTNDLGHYIEELMHDSKSR